MGVSVGYADDTDRRGAWRLGVGRPSKEENKIVKRLREQPSRGREESIDKGRRFERRGRGFELVNYKHIGGCRDRSAMELPCLFFYNLDHLSAKKTNLRQGTSLRGTRASSC